MQIKFFMSLFLVLLLGVSSSRAENGAPSFEKFDEYISKGLADWKVPGLAIAVVKDGSIVYAKGFGVKDITTNEPVDQDTLFAIGSISKSFTAAAIATLVDEKKIGWNDRVQKYLPNFELSDPYVTRELTITDILCHRSGLPRADEIWYGTEFDREEILRRVRFVDPDTSFRSAFGYQNIMFLAAGEVVEQVAGTTWDEAIKTRFFGPLKMEHSNTSVTALKDEKNVAMPHQKIDGEIRKVPYRNIDNIAPAGSINSSVSDMAHYLQFQLSGGSFDGKQLVTAASMREMHEPRIAIPLDAQTSRMNPDTHFVSYGLGWMLSDYHGRKLIQHGGGIDGMSALVGMVPEEKLGIVILTNLGGAALHQATMNWIIDRYMGNPDKDWSQNMVKMVAFSESAAKAAEKKREEKRVAGTKPSLALEKYAGEYESEKMGKAKVEVMDGKAVMYRGPHYTGDLEHWHFDTFRAVARDPVMGKAFVTFNLTADGDVKELAIDGLDEFARKAEEKKEEAK